MQKAKIDVWGVGTKLVTAYDQPALGAVYKIVAIEDENGVLRNTIKLSNNAEKVSTPGKKQVWRITSRERKSEGDYIMTALMLARRTGNVPSDLYHINKTVKNFDAVPLLVDIFQEGIWSIISRAWLRFKPMRKGLINFGMSTNGSQSTGLSSWPG